MTPMSDEVRFHSIKSAFEEVELGTSESLGELMAAWTLWRITKGKPLLDNLKALKKEGAE